MFSVASTAFYMFNVNQLQWKWDLYELSLTESTVSKVKAHMYTEWSTREVIKRASFFPDEVKIWLVVFRGAF